MSNHVSQTAIVENSDEALLQRLLGLQYACRQVAYELCASASGKRVYGRYDNLLADVVPNVVVASGARNHIRFWDAKLEFLMWLQHESSSSSEEEDDDDEEEDDDDEEEEEEEKKEEEKERVIVQAASARGKRGVRQIR